ncbi:hypothetical protein N7481_005297 [Penicillium waksmanii]|uniref:uncharacterized protein n=1 Tax=Penicillium waksmanii TaxID=69791 RepID=UPI0025474E5C|nr:uncharacterized protein N7481_005297 [Penicillium waksmanii]KAJ5983198.1 hypothetical protein N7481_005297 [Penicillium waksmanii]
MAPGFDPPPKTGVVGSEITSHTMETPFQQSNRASEQEDTNEAVLTAAGNHMTWLNDETTFFNMVGEFSDESGNMLLPLDISAIDSILFPSKDPDLSIAERLEFMAHFTSTQGMRTFADRESFRHRQEMAREAYEMQALQGYKVRQAKATTLDLDILEVKPEEYSHDVNDPDPLHSKSRDLIVNLRDIISNRTNDDVITVEWTPIINQLCKDFFQPSNMRRFLEYFWSLWYPHCPIVHKPLFDPFSASPGLLCVMVIIGACLSPDENDNQASRKWLDSVEELIFCQVYFRSDRELLMDQPGQRKEIVQCMQAAYLVSSLQKREGSVEAQARIRRHRHASMVTLARHIGPRKASHRHLDMSHTSSNSWWEQFAEEEELIRTIIFVFLIDAALTILHNSPPRMVVPELKMDVACPESCFQAESASECMKELHTWATTRFWKSRLSIVSVVRRICQCPIEESIIEDFAGLGTLNLFTLVQAIHSLMFQLHNSLVFESTLAPIQTGLDNWREIWNSRVPEDTGLPDTPENLWKRVGFLRHASEFWQLARLLMGKIMAANQDDGENAEEMEQLSRYDHTDMGEVNELIMEYRRMNLGVT